MLRFNVPEELIQDNAVPQIVHPNIQENGNNNGNIVANDRVARVLRHGDMNVRERGRKIV